MAVAGDSEAEDVVHRLGGRGYRPVELLEQEYVKRMSGVRLERGGSDVVVDLLFASSGIEDEVVAGATRLEVLPQLTAPVATTGHLIALRCSRGVTMTSPTSKPLSPARRPPTLMSPAAR